MIDHRCEPWKAPVARVSPDPLAGFLVMCCEEARSPLWIAPFWRMRMMAALRVQEGGIGDDEIGREQEETSSAWLRLVSLRMTKTHSSDLSLTFLSSPKKAFSISCLEISPRVPVWPDVDDLNCLGLAAWTSPPPPSK